VVPDELVDEVVDEVADELASFGAGLDSLGA
jgi:hypothetical protein